VNERRPIPETDVLSESAAKQLLARASELDAALKGGTSVATLRAAAAEAGISPAAFDAALVEAQAEGQTPVPATGTAHRSKVWPRVAVAALAFLAVLTVAVERSTIAAGTIETTMQVRCISADDAAELIRPYGDRNTSVRIRPGARTLRIRATPAQLDRMRSVIDQAERASPTCTSR